MNANIVDSDTGCEDLQLDSNLGSATHRVEQESMGQRVFDGIRPHSREARRTPSPEITPQQISLPSPPYSLEIPLPRSPSPAAGERD